MIPYLLFCIIVLLLTYINKNTKSKKMNFLEFIIVLIISLFSGLRYGVGWDYWSYVDVIEQKYVTNINLSYEYLNIYFMNFVRLIDFNQLYFLVNSFITVFLISLTLKKYSSNFNLSILFFLFFPIFFLNSFSVIRNFTAIALVFFGVRFIIERKFFMYLLIVIFATLIHNTAIFTIIFYFLYKIKFSTVQLLLTLPLLYFIRVFSIYLIKLSGISYAYYFTYEQNTEGRFTILIYLFFLFLLLFFKKRLIMKSNSKEFMLNQFIFGVLIFLTFLNLGPVASRLSIYFTLYILLFIPDFFDFFKYKSEKNALKFIYIVILVLFFSYTLLIGSETYIPYELNLLR